ncbi:GLPGLI family protein [Chryseobacterium taichungense]|uniref:GLPGLI family protein n=1 Tax=Chryseobacterium taichungense TaxID=295069 RepID=UPI0028AD7326|nr:GLPGLI family protein [Chryseobacterium taichungense]
MKKILIIVAILIINSLYSQKMTGIYELKFRINPDKDSLITNIFYLDIDGFQSTFRSEIERKSDSLINKKGFGYGRKSLFITDLYSKKDLKTNEIQKLIISGLVGNRYFIKIDDELKWEIKNEKQKIGNLDCQKAEVDYGGRHWIAWFSETVNLQEGPYIFHGLPGLIIKITDQNLDYDFNLIQLKKAENYNIYFHKSKEKQITWLDFQRMIQNYYNDPLYEIKNSGMKYTIVDDKENISTLNPKMIQKKHQTNLKNNDSNLIELDKMIELK